VKQHGATWQAAYVFSQSGESIATELTDTAGIRRSELHKILATRTLAAGVHVRLGTTVETLSQVPEGVEVKLINGHREQYSLVVGAHGIYSKLRERMFPQAQRPKFTGQVIYRIVAERPHAIDRTHCYIGADSKLGFHPVSRTHMYMSLLQRSP
jgi:2-polyprenyl-6-methoxyphenol hydroxylase-like FAD-dependent oxidoreductase